jgi:hypothetical protein
MKTAMRIILAVFGFIFSYLFVYWVPFSLVPRAHETGLLPNIVSFVIAMAVGVLLWKKTGSVSKSLALSILMGGIIVGTISFLLGFFGPLIFYPDANLGPLLGIFITGPVGFILGLIGGGLYWMVKAKKRQQV